MTLYKIKDRDKIKAKFEITMYKDMGIARIEDINSSCEKHLLVSDLSSFI